MFVSRRPMANQVKPVEADSDEEALQNGEDDAAAGMAD